MEHELVKTAMIGVGVGCMEPIRSSAPLKADSLVGRLPGNPAVGLHHLAIRADDIEMRFKQLQEQDINLASVSVRTGAAGHRYFCVHPASTGGVLIEMVGDALSVSLTDGPRADEARADECGAGR